MKPSENTVEKGENAGNQHFLLFPQCFLPFPKDFQSHLFLLRARSFKLDQCKNLSFGKELIADVKRILPNARDYKGRNYAVRKEQCFMQAT